MRKIVRQCAWCLRLINDVGERTSTFPMPKIYEATHGICKVCGTSWLEAVGDLSGDAMIISQPEDGRHHIKCIGEERFPAITPSPLPENETQMLSGTTILTSHDGVGDGSKFVSDTELCLV